MSRDANANHRNVECNGHLLKQFRAARGWTQEDLASASGYSVRLIAKAEAGGSVQTDTIEHLAATLSTDEKPCFSEELACEPKKLALEFIENLTQHEAEVVSKSRHIIDDDVVFIMAGSADTLPFAGEHRGIEAMDAACREFFAFLEVYSIELKAITAEGNEIVAYLRIAAGLKGLSEVNDFPHEPAMVILRFRFQRGQIVWLHDDFNVEQAERWTLIQQDIMKQHREQEPLE